MPKYSAPLLAITLLASAAVPVSAAPKIPLSAAMAQCEPRALRYSNTLANADAETPTRYKVDQLYRSCVFAKSGKYPPAAAKVKGIRMSGSAAIGIVVKE